MKTIRRLHLEIQKHRAQAYGLIRSSYRENGRVKHTSHGRITGMSVSQLKLLQAAFRGEVVPKEAPQALQLLGSKEHGASAVVLAVARELGLDRVLYSRREAWGDDGLAMIAGRVVYAGSKLALSNQWKNTTLWEQCGVTGPVDVDEHCYAPMDRLLARQAAIEKALAARHLQEGRLVLYDITSSYFEGQYADSDLVLFGYNRDGKRGHEQMVVALVCNEEGCPVGVEVFPGNTQDASTVPQKIADLRQQYGVKEILFVGDRGMITQASAEQVQGVEGLNLISALTHRQIVELLDRKVITPELFDERRIVEVIDPQDLRRRYALCRNPQSAQRETATRQRLLELTRAGLDKIVHAKRRGTAAKIGSRVGRVLQQYKMGKFVTWEVREGRLNWQFNQERIAAELLLDGCYVICADVKPETMSSEDLVGAYKKLRFVEMAFRNLKTVQLELRPVFHKTDDRIRAHVFLCVLAYYLQWHMKQRLQPLFNSDGEGKNRQGTFENVIHRLMAIRRQKVSLAGVEFFQVTTPEPDQKRILDLLGVSL
jgi:transposase